MVFLQGGKGGGRCEGGWGGVTHAFSGITAKSIIEDSRLLPSPVGGASDAADLR